MNIKRFRLGSDWSNRMIIYANVTKKKTDNNQTTSDKIGVNQIQEKARTDLMQYDVRLGNTQFSVE